MMRTSRSVPRPGVQCAGPMRTSRGVPRPDIRCGGPMRIFVVCRVLAFDLLARCGLSVVLISASEREINERRTSADLSDDSRG